MPHCSRRGFLKAGVAATTFSGGARLPAQTAKRSATDFVTLGKSGVKVTRLAFGTGTVNGRVQRQLGQEEFTKLVRHAYDRGIRFFETADSYPGMPQMLATALKGIPRDSYRLMTKMTITRPVNVASMLDQYRKDLNSEYFDILLMHCLMSPTWPQDLTAVQDGLSEAKSRKIISSHGASVHGLPALRNFPGNKWLDVAMIRMNHNGTIMDGETQRPFNPESVNEVVSHVHKVHGEGKGVISMKLVGEGRFTNREDRRAALKHAFNVAGVDAVTIGYKSPAEIDEAIENIGLALNA